MKNIITLLLAIITASHCFAYDFEVDGIYYNILSKENKTVEVTNPPAASYSGIIVINDTIVYSNNNYTVKSIGKNAFELCAGLTRITIPNSITSIGSYAFYECYNLTSINIPNSVISIGDGAFCGCDNLTSITIPNSVSSINSNTFSGCNITSITIPNSVSSIGKYAFSECKKLTSITIPNSVNSIGSYAFYGCNSLTSIINESRDPQYIENGTFPVKSIDIYVPKRCRSTYSFANVWGNYNIIGTDYDFEVDGIYYNILSEDDKTVEITYKDDYFTKYYTIHYHISGYNGDVEIPEKVLYKDNFYIVTKIDNSTFSDYNWDDGTYYTGNITSIKIPNTVTCIGRSAFSGCKLLTNINIPKRVTSIGGYSFHECTGLTNITIPNSVSSIEESTFSGCSGLTEVIFSDSVTYIGSDAFYGCSGLTEITIPNRVASIGQNTFYGCSGLTSITIPNSVTSIGSSAFYGCSGLTSITIPNSVYSIGSYAFNGCSALTDVINFATTPQSITSNTFPSHKILHVLPGYKELYQTYQGWNSFVIKEDAVLPVEEVNANTFTLSDGSSYNSTVRTTSDNLSYSRTFNNTTWQALYVPFSIPVSKLTEAGIVIAELNDTHQRDYNSDGVADSTWIEFFTLQSGSTEANYPYLIKANEQKSVTINLENVTVEHAENVSIECSTTRQRFTFTGTYDGVSGSEMYSKNYYALAGGSLKRAASYNASIKPQRWYMTIENKNGTTPSYFAPSMRFVVDGIEDETTSIEAVLGQSSDLRVYSITGSVHSGELKPGIYVQNGKKIIVK